MLYRAREMSVVLVKGLNQLRLGIGRPHNCQVGHCIVCLADKISYYFISFKYQILYN